MHYFHLVVWVLQHWHHIHHFPAPVGTPVPPLEPITANPLHR